MKPSLVVLALSALASFGCFAPSVWVEAEESFEMEAAGVAGIECDTHNGAILMAAAGQGERVAVRARKRAGAATQEAAEKALQAIEVVRGRRGSQVVLGWRWRDEERDRHGEVSFEIRQPEGLTVRAEAHNGEIRVGGPVAGCKLTSHNGAITVGDCRGQLAATTHNGTVRATGRLSEVTIEANNGAVTVEAVAGAPRGSVTTHNGTVTLRLAEAVDVELDCETGNGTISYALELEALADESGKSGYKGPTRSKLWGKRGKPSGALVVRTHNGSVHVGKLQ